jgi:hypothetical protein
MTATVTQLIGGAFQDSEGNLLANGYLEFVLNNDENVTGVGNIASGVAIRIQLDSVGNIASSSSTPSAPNQYIWANDVMLPINSYYRVTGYTQAGQPAWGPNNQQVTSGGTGGGTFDTGTWVPNAVFSWTPPPQPVSLQTNGTPNIDQAVENLIAGSHITLTADSNGGTTIAATVPAGISLETNGTPNTSQTVENLIAGANISLTADSMGGTTIAVTGGAAFGANAILFGPFLQPPIFSSSTNAIASSANQVRVTKLCLPAPITISKCTFNINSGGGSSGAKVAFGIYSHAGAKIVDSGVATINSNVVTTLTFTPITLPAGTYYFAQTCSSTALQTGGLPNGSMSTIFLNQFNANDVWYGTAANASSSGVLPSTLGTLTADNNTGTASGISIATWE